MNDIVVANLGDGAEVIIDNRTPQQKRNDETREKVLSGVKAALSASGIVYTEAPFNRIRVASSIKHVTLNIECDFDHKGYWKELNRVKVEVDSYSYRDKCRDTYYPIGEAGSFNSVKLVVRVKTMLA